MRILKLQFAKSKSKALCFWGKEDTATPLYTGEKIAGLIENSEFYPLDGDHFFFLTHKDFIATNDYRTMQGTIHNDTTKHYFLRTFYFSYGLLFYYELTVVQL